MSKEKKKREEDIFNLEQKQMRHNEMDEIINKEKRAKREKIKKEYNLMLQRTKGLLLKKTQLILKNSGQKKEPFVLPQLHPEKTTVNKPNENKFSINVIYNNNFAELTTNQKEKKF